MADYEIEETDQELRIKQSRSSLRSELKLGGCFLLFFGLPALLFGASSLSFMTRTLFRATHDPGARVGTAVLATVAFVLFLVIVICHFLAEFFGREFLKSGRRTIGGNVYRFNRADGILWHNREALCSLEQIEGVLIVERQRKGVHRHRLRLATKEQQIPLRVGFLPEEVDQFANAIARFLDLEITRKQDESPSTHYPSRR